MYHLLEHINQDIKGDEAKIRAQQCIKLNQLLPNVLIHHLKVSYNK